MYSPAEPLVKDVWEFVHIFGTNDMRRAASIVKIAVCQQHVKVKIYFIFSGEPSAKQQCLSSANTGGTWASQACEKKMPFVCTSVVTPPSKPPCDSGWTWNKDSNACYKVYSIIEILKILLETCERILLNILF